jgi:hypothetical protein
MNILEKIKQAGATAMQSISEAISAVKKHSDII